MDRNGFALMFERDLNRVYNANIDEWHRFLIEGPREYLGPSPQMPIPRAQPPIKYDLSSGAVPFKVEGDNKPNNRKNRRNRFSK